MHSEMANELWSELKRYIGSSDREEAADILVTVLINNDEDIADIRRVFAGDTDVRRVLAAYGDDEPDETAEEYDDFDDYDED
jgi:hypothetical protein